MRYQILNVEKQDNLSIVNIKNSAGNEVGIVELSQELVAFCSETNIEEDTRVVVFTGFGAKSSSGEISKGFTVSLLGENEVNWGSLSEPIAKLDLPVIAVIEGDTVGQWLEFALACDIRIATEASHFGFPDIKNGFIPRDGGTQRLSRLVGRSKALEMILTGEIIDAREAYRIGLVNKIVSTEDLTAVTMKMAREMALRAPFSMGYAKEAIYKGMDLTLEQGLRLEADLYFLLHTTKDRMEGIQAFREKRTPRFEGK